MAKAAGVLFCGGGTGGHIFPGLAVADVCRERGLGPLRWVGDPDRMEADLVPKRGIPLLPWGLSRPRLKDPRWLWLSLRRLIGCYRAMRQDPPKVVVALGGYASLVPGLLAPILRRPLVVLEQNALPGKTNQLLARFASLVVTQFPEARERLPGQKVRMIGNPVRPLIPRPRGQEKTLRLLVMGGSLSAKTINDLLVEAAPLLGAIDDLHVVHLAGQADVERVQAAYDVAGVSAEVLGFCDDMPALYDRIDVTFCRSGATTVAECCAAGLGALYMPLPWAADDHQTVNAGAVARLGGAAVFKQSMLTAAGLVKVIARLAQRRHEVARMGQQALLLARPQAAAETTTLLQQLIYADGKGVP